MDDESLRALIAAVEALERGEYTVGSLDGAAGRDDLLGELARAVVRMACAVQEREHSLRKEILELSIQIDERKKEAAVAQITDSAYFRNLQTLAKTTRARRARGNPDTDP